MSQAATLALGDTRETTPSLGLVLVGVAYGPCHGRCSGGISSFDTGPARSALGIRTSESAWILGLGPLFSGLSQPACALLSDWQHTRRWGLVGLALAGVGICSLGFASELVPLVLIYGVGMIGVGMFHPVAATTVGHLGQHKRNRAVSLFFVSGMLGGVSGTFCWPRFLRTADGFDTLPVFMVPVLLLVVLTVWCFKQLPSPKAAYVVDDAKSVSRSNWTMVGFLYVIGIVAILCEPFALLSLRPLGPRRLCDRKFRLVTTAGCRRGCARWWERSMPPRCLEWQLAALSPEVLCAEAGKRPHGAGAHSVLTDHRIVSLGAHKYRVCACHVVGCRLCLHDSD